MYIIRGNIQNSVQHGHQPIRKDIPKSCIRSGAPFNVIPCSRACSRKGPKWPGSRGHLRNLDTLFTNLAEPSGLPPEPAAAAALRTDLSGHMDDQPSAELSLACERSLFLLTQHQAAGGSAMAPWCSEDTQKREAKRQRLSGLPSPGPSLWSVLPWKSWVCSCQPRYLLKCWAGPAGLHGFQDL